MHHIHVAYMNLKKIMNMCALASCVCVCVYVCV